MRKSLKLAAIAAAAAFATPAFAAPTVDGSKDAAYGTAVAVQSINTEFGNANPNGGSELNAAYSHVEGGVLYLLITGNLENNFNKLNIFIDSQAGGENVLTAASPTGNNPSNDGWANKHAGFTFDTGFTADYMLIARNGNFGGAKFDLDFSSVGSAATVVTAGNVFGGSTQGSNPSALSNGIGVGFNNTNILGVVGGTGAANQAAALAVTTGLELAIPLSAIGNPALLSEIKISAMVNNGDHNYLSNQFLGGLAAGTGNLGGNGSGGFTGTVSGINLNNFAGNQFFTVVIPEPAALSLLAMPALALIRRRK